MDTYKHQESWFFQGNLGRKKKRGQGFSIADLVKISTIGSNDELLRNVLPEDLNKVRTIITERLQSQRQFSFSVATDLANLLPLSFLEIGTKRGQAVCRIVRYFSLADFQEIIAEIQDSDDKDEYNSITKLTEIFAIPEKLAQKVFVDGVDALEALKNISENQLAQLNPIAIGTGFLVGGTHLMTNQHVIADPKEAKECVAQFNYVKDSLGNIQTVVEYEFAPEILFVSNPALDYTLVQLKAGAFTQQAGYQFDWIQLIEDDTKVAPGINKGLLEGAENTSPITQAPTYINGDLVFIIQHPKGERKQIVQNDNRVLDYSENGLLQDFLRYGGASNYGSSGSPVFNSNWQLVALHHAAIAKDSKNQEKAKSVSAKSKNKPEIIAYQGVRICRIIENLKKKSFTDPKIASFIQDFVVTSEQLNYPPLPSALEFDGESSYIDLGADVSLDISEAITVEALIQAKPELLQGTVINRVNAYSLFWNKGQIGVKLHSSKAVLTNKCFFNDNLWHHVAFTWVKNTDNITIYLDGESQKTEEAKDFPSKSSISQKPNNKLYIGCDRETEKEGYFHGAIAEVRLWKLARTPERIKANMHRRLDKDDQAGLIGYWQFEEVGGYKVYNSAMKDVPSLPDINFFTSNQPIQPLFGLQLNGKNEYINCGDYENLKIDQAITIEAWIKSNEQNRDGIIVNRGGSWNEVGYCLWLNKGNICVDLSSNDDDNADGARGYSNNTVSVLTQNAVLNHDSWHHIAFTWEQNSKEIKIYIDGEKQSVNTSPFFEGPIGEPRVSLNIARSQNYGYYFNGCIAEVRLWKIARTQEQIKENMTRQLKEDNEKEGLVGYWQLTEAEGDEAENSVSNDDNGIVDGGKWLRPYVLLAANQSAYGVTFKTKRLKACQYPALPLPFGLKLNGDSDRIDCENNQSLDSTEALTVETWFKHRFGNCLIVSQYDRDNNGYSLSWYEGKIRVTFQSNNPYVKTIVYTRDNAPQDCVWHHIAFTWDQNSQEIAIYIDGRIQDSVVEGQCQSIVFAGQTKSIGLFTGSLNRLKQANLTIAAKDKNEIYYNVAIAEVRLWKVAHTQDHIKANMSQRLKGTEKGLIGYWRLDDGGENNKVVRNLVSDHHHGKIDGGKWFPTQSY
ncbi:MULTISPECIES: LamG-like jellyroll fold domain-containing protein [Fischerella]|nr:MULTISPECIES: LamG-like jellyroll fold domain-containing protein [Fischerella]MBD2433254.1 trypsin-like peptidase domain-containing protein [Fischerella sp. FACHB-380]